MDQYAVVGNPVEHSRSPFIHARFAASTGQTLEYGRLLAPVDGFAAAVRRFAAEGADFGHGRGHARGCNVTVPFKFEACALASRCTPRAELAGAANVLCFDADGWVADNTDGVGLVRDLERNAGCALAGRSVLLVGAGGAAAGVLGPLLQARPARLVIANRRPERARELVDRHRAVAEEAQVALAAAEAPPTDPFDIVIDATSASLQGGAAPFAASVLRAATLAVNLMYGPAARPFLAWAAAQGATARDGLGMLVEQAAEAFAVWRGVRPQTGEVLAALRAEVDAAAARS